MSCRADACNRRSTREGKKESGRRDDRNPLYVWFQSLLWASRIAPAWGQARHSLGRRGSCRPLQEGAGRGRGGARAPTSRGPFGAGPRPAGWGPDPTSPECHGPGWVERGRFTLAGDYCGAGLEGRLCSGSGDAATVTSKPPSQLGGDRTATSTLYVDSARPLIAGPGARRPPPVPQSVLAPEQRGCR